MKTSIDINCDMGESIPGIPHNIDEQIMPWVSSSNISCGAHSGTKEGIMETVKQALHHNVRIGAHPSYPDKINFGRKSMSISAVSFLNSLIAQLEFLENLVTLCGGTISYVKPHGALYHDITKHNELASLLVDVVQKHDNNLAIMCMPGSEAEKVCNERQCAFIREGFADRKYITSTSLAPRTSRDAVLSNESDLINQIKYLLRGQVLIKTGMLDTLHIDSICFHSDSPNVLNHLIQTHNFFKQNNVTISSDSRS